MKKNPGAGFKIRNPYPIILLAALSLALLYSLFWLLGPAQQPYSESVNPGPICEDGQTKPCDSGNCSGTALCIDGTWSGCRWAQVCVPGSSEVCLTQNCPYGVKKCNSCGTGFGPCGSP